MTLKIVNNRKNDVAGIGSALLDFTLNVEDDILASLSLKKGQMHLIDNKESKKIFNAIKDFNLSTSPGGSAANTLAGILNFSGSAVFLGTVGKDKNGEIYISETSRSGVASKIKKIDTITGHAITFITPDSERTFATHLGAAVNFSKNDIDWQAIKDSKILHLEGYLFELPSLREACMDAIKFAKKNNVLISIDLSDPALIGRIFDTFKDVVEKYADIVFVNEEEALAFTGKQELDALNKLAQVCSIAIVKLGARGSLVKDDNKIYEIPSFKTTVVNTNGAGDMFAAGFLYGIANNINSKDSAILGSFASAKVVASAGARVKDSFDYKKILK